MPSNNLMTVKNKSKIIPSNRIQNFHVNKIITSKVFKQKISIFPR